jgi:hypothetical protein
MAFRFRATDPVPAPVPTNRPRFVNHTGAGYGKLTVIGFAGSHYRANGRQRFPYWWCRCKCGRVGQVKAGSLSSRNTRSCGVCYRAVIATRHGHSRRGRKSPTYTIWCSMLTRCHGQADRDGYQRRGIAVCRRWRKSFANFLADMGERPSSAHSIDRRNTRRGYCPSNCRWATRTTQARNTTRNRLLTHDGVTQCLAAWGEATGIKASVIARRIDKHGWSLHRALATPVRPTRRQPA